MVYYPKTGKYRSGRKRRSAHQYKKKVDKIKTESDVKEVINKETPWSVVAQETNFALTTTPTVQHQLSNIEFSNSNDRPDSRKSKKISVMYMKFRGYLDVGDRTNLIRVMVVRNKDPQVPSAAFNPANMFEINNGIGTQPNNLFAEPNKRFVDVKYDKIFNLQDTSQTSPATRVQNAYFQIKVNMKNEVWKYFTENNNTQEFTRNMKDYFIVAFSDSAILPNPSLRLSSYVFFKNHIR